jgi:hypothetical protein
MIISDYPAIMFLKSFQGTCCTLSLYIVNYRYCISQITGIVNCLKKQEVIKS